MKNLGLVFDRDGTLIKHIHYLSDFKKVELLNGVFDFLNLLNNKNNVKLFLHTNQSGVERGYFDYESVEKCNNRMLHLIGEKIKFEKICIATSLSQGKKSYRKPSPRFGLEIMKEYNIDVPNLIYIGDSESDLMTAYNLKCRGFGLNTGLVKFKKNYFTINKIKYPIFDNILEITKLIV